VVENVFRFFETTDKSIKEWDQDFQKGIRKQNRRGGIIRKAVPRTGSLKICPAQSNLGCKTTTGVERVNFTVTLNSERPCVVLRGAPITTKSLPLLE
jgi:hypothetical protein